MSIKDFMVKIDDLEGRLFKELDRLDSAPQLTHIERSQEVRNLTETIVALRRTRIDTTFTAALNRKELESAMATIAQERKQEQEEKEQREKIRVLKQAEEARKEATESDRRNNKNSGLTE